MNTTEKGWLRRTLNTIGDFFKRKYDTVRNWFLNSPKMTKAVNLRNRLSNNIRKHRTLWFVGSVFTVMTATILSMSSAVGLVGLAAIALGTVLFSGPDMATGAFRLLEVTTGLIVSLVLALVVTTLFNPAVATGLIWAAIKITIVLGVAAYLHAYFRAERYNMEVAHFAAQTKGKQLDGIEEVRKAAAIVKERVPRL